MAAAIAGLMVAGAAALTVEQSGLPASEARSAARERYGHLQREVNREARRLREAAELAAVAPALPAGPGLTIEVRSPFTTHQLDSLRAIVQQELPDSTSLRARVGVFLVPATRPGGVAKGTAHHLHGAARPQPTCVAVGSQPVANSALPSYATPFSIPRFRRDSGMVSSPHVLRGCRFWARYGAPGPQVAEWLERRGYEFAGLETTALQPWPDTLRPRGLFGRWRNMLDELEEQTLACHHGDPAACAAFFLGRARDRASSFYDQGRVEAALLAALEHEFGGERFARFWSSNEDVASAFHSAFGVLVTAWLPHFLERYYGPADSGPGVGLATMGLSLLAVGTLLGVALAAAHRHRS